ncbi:hypothetical protein FHS85_003610 [Rhodoligotrophos appendicifer]
MIEPSLNHPLPFFLPLEEPDRPRLSVTKFHR